jgi:hypothetical protein
MEKPAGIQGFVNQTWIDHTLDIGEKGWLKITVSYNLCVMTPPGKPPKGEGNVRAQSEP